MRKKYQYTYNNKDQKISWGKERIRENNMVIENKRDELSSNKPVIATNISGLKLPNKRPSNRMFFIPALCHLWEKHLKYNNIEILNKGIGKIYKVNCLIVWMCNDLPLFPWNTIFPRKYDW